MRKWEEIDPGSIDPTRFRGRGRIIRMFMHDRGYLLVHIKRKGRKEEKRGMWELWIGLTHLATKCYWQIPLTAPPRKWANDWIAKREKCDEETTAGPAADERLHDGHVGGHEAGEHEPAAGHHPDDAAR